ncbi:DUF6292 family protein [Thermocrispum sp.]|uniref:DUF6292 family protein n=1 Tax=Thermocrispum agreste TaxID=37925 RepID=A0A2W4JGS8_9PSEU|nr:DUF6292 family protein [Thermocrispum sp.]PZM98462.1 MAG: hypothetical protein DIU77_07930 [Thermocrispum agreste]
MTTAPILPTAGAPGDEPTPHQTEHGLRAYVRQVAAEVGAGPEAQWCEWAESANAYIALENRLPDKPTRDLALIWDDECGWAVGMETGSGEDLLILAWYVEDLLPPPRAVATFVRCVVHGIAGSKHPPSGVADRRSLAGRLAAYA